jgi:hypothetical protein
MNTKIFNKLNQMVKDSPQLLLDVDALEQAINGEFCIDISVQDTVITSLVHDINEEVMAQYFSKVWQPETKKYKYSGLSIIDEVNAMNPDNVLDIGCGYNEFKGKIQNLVGIDPYNNKADHMVHTLDYCPPANTLYDVTICLGSINFGSTDKIIRELNKVVKLTKKGGLLIFRANPGIQHGAFESQWIDFFDWDITFIMNVAQALNCTVKQLRRDIPKTAVNGGRLYFVLRKN